MQNIVTLKPLVQTQQTHQKIRIAVAKHCQQFLANPFAIEIQEQAKSEVDTILSVPYSWQ